MNRDDIMRLREQADDWAEQHLQCTGEYHADFHVVSDERFAILVAAAEREACAQVCEHNANRLHNRYVTGSEGSAECAEDIRARGEE